MVGSGIVVRGMMVGAGGSGRVVVGMNWRLEGPGGGRLVAGLVTDG